LPKLEEKFNGLKQVVKHMYGMLSEYKMKEFRKARNYRKWDSRRNRKPVGHPPKKSGPPRKKPVGHPPKKSSPPPKKSEGHPPKKSGPPPKKSGPPPKKTINM